jgi:threonine dehydrogenase-like Zn-dependent dehydrogenase
METDEITPVRCIFKEVTVTFVLGYNDAEFQETIDALRTGKIDPRPMVTDVVGIEQVPAMFQALRKPGGQAKVIVEFPH